MEVDGASTYDEKHQLYYNIAKNNDCPIIRGGDSASSITTHQECRNEGTNAINETHYNEGNIEIFRRRNDIAGTTTPIIGGRYRSSSNGI